MPAFPVPRQNVTQVLIREAGAKLNRDELARLVRLYETILANTDDFIYIFDPQGRFLYANARLLKVWAKSLEQIVGKTCYDLGYPDWHADMHMREIEQIVRDKTAIRNEVFFTGDSGISGHYDYIFKPVLDAEGNVEMIVGATRDVTDRKRDEEQLKTMQLELQKRAGELSETAGKFRALFDQAAIFAGIMTPDGILVEINDLALAQCGYHVADVLGLPFWECGWWSRSRLAQDKIRAAIAAAAAGTLYRETLPFYYADGTERVLDFSLTPIRNQEGQIIYLNPSGVDITDASRAHAHASFLSHLTQQLSVVSDEVEINRIATAELGRFLGAQRCFCFQVLPDGQHVRVLPDWRVEGEPSFAGDYPFGSLGASELVAALGKEIVAVDDVQTHPWTAPAAAGTYLALKIASFAFAPFTHEGRWVASVGVVCDRPHRWLDDQKALLENVAARVWPLIERARIGAALRQANEQLGDRATHLEAIVQQRTHKLSEIIGELEAFSYSISHDLRAPLRSMIGFSDVLLEDYAGKLDASGADYLQRISRAGRRMDRLIQDVLNFSRISSSEIVLQPVRPDLILSDVIRSYPNLQTANVTITVAPGLPAVRGNEGLLTQCVSNLLENAVKFVPTGRQAQIDVWAETQSGRTRLYFRDNGIGIPEHSLGRIFEIFQRVGRDAEGTGIGLAIVRRAAEKMGGTVGVQSELGQGSLFWLDLESCPGPAAIDPPVPSLT